MASSVHLIVCLGVVYVILCVNESAVNATLSNTHEGIGTPLEIADDYTNGIKYTKFTGTAEDLRTEGPGGYFAGEGQEEVVSPLPLSTEMPPSGLESSSSIYEMEEVEEEGEVEDNIQGGEEQTADGLVDVADDGGLDLGRVLAAKRSNDAKKRMYKKKRGKKVSKRQRITSLTQRQEQQILAMHNTYRKRVPGPAADMEEMHWDLGLAKMAKKYAKKCTWEHGNPPNTTPFNHVGQNLAYGSGISISPMYLVTLWYREKAFYNIDTNECRRNAVCGHYTQIVWANTKYVGCSLNYCRQLYDPTNGNNYPSSLFLVCNYGPGGNVHSHYPYQIGRQCTECASGLGKCKGGLCSDCDIEDSDCECALSCKNGGTRDSQACRCDCPPGWTGSQCQHTCNNTHDWCVKYWPKEWCFKYDDVNPVEQLCPALCGVCECGGPDCANGGTKNAQTCNCDCVEPWSGQDCSVCNIQCEHGTLDAASCHCTCKDGWMGETCSEPCANSHQLCYKGWYPNWCDDEHPYVPKFCQAMCGVCKVPTRTAFFGSSGCQTTCYNDGILNEDTCECQCAPGWHGEHCTAICEDKFFHCAWSTGMCTSNPDFARNYCPASCEFCRVAPSDEVNDNTVEVN